MTRVSTPAGTSSGTALLPLPLQKAMARGLATQAALYAQGRTKPGKVVTKYGVKIVAIDAKEDGRGDPRAYVQSLGFSPVSIANGDEIAKAYGIQYIPGLLIVDGKGKVAYRRPWTDLPAGKAVGELWDGQVRTALNGLVGK